jgi:hypothetical protein
VSIPEAEFQMGGGTPEQLPEGAAQTLNEATPKTGRRVTPEAAPLEETPPEAATPADYEPAYQPDNEEDDFLADSTLYPDESVTTGATAPALRPLPPDVVDALPIFHEAAQRPDAPQALKVLSYLLKRYANE